MAKLFLVSPGSFDFINRAQSGVFAASSNLSQFFCVMCIGRVCTAFTISQLYFHFPLSIPFLPWCSSSNYQAKLLIS